MKNNPEHLPAQAPGTPDPQRRQHDNPLTVKIVFIGIIMLILLIPGGMILSLIDERAEMMEGAQQEVARMWSGEQHITGPIVSIPYSRETKDSDGRSTLEKARLVVLPENLSADGNIACRQLRRGLYDTNVYNSEITLTGSFVIPDELQALCGRNARIDLGASAVSIGISDLRGIEESIAIEWNGTRRPTVADLDNDCFDTGVTARIDLNDRPEQPGASIPFAIT